MSRGDDNRGPGKPTCAVCGAEIYKTPFETKYGRGWIHTESNRERCRDTRPGIALPAKPSRS